MKYQKTRNGLFTFDYKSKLKVSNRYIDIVSVKENQEKVSVVVYNNKKRKLGYNWTQSKPFEVRLKWLQTDLLLEHERIASFREGYEHLYAEFMKEQLDGIDSLPFEESEDETKDSLKHCHKTGKKRFDSKQAARNAFRDKSARLRTYVCPFCKKWHMSNPDKK